MEVKQFRIKNFRSIVDTEWCPFSRDGVTVLVGQNESGKTSVLDALATTFATRTITADDIRTGAPLPQILLRLHCPFSELEPFLSAASSFQLSACREFWESRKGDVTLDFTWERTAPGAKNPFACEPRLVDCSELEESLATLAVLEASSESSAGNGKPIEDAVGAQVQPSTPAADVTQPSRASTESNVNSTRPFPISSVADAVYQAAPEFILFSEKYGLLPNEIELDDQKNPTGTGAGAASNYLWAAGIDLSQMLSDDRRSRESQMHRANTKLTDAFNSFWSQKIGKATKLSLSCEIHFHDATGDTSIAGRPYLVFWISDGHTRLYPSQRSQGVRWFVSFFLQLKAARRLYDHSIFLLDEPGANLHSKAQADVLRLINDLRREIPIIYSTHSPHLIEYEHLHRIHAVQRIGDDEDSPTVILDAHRLGSATTDTLSPILSAMGTDFWSQQVIQKKHNVLLEEISGFYYMTAFWKLTNARQPAHFIASTGVNKILVLANLFLGWGLDFIAVIDDDNQGRAVFKQLTDDLYGGDIETANRRIFKMKGLDGIEDIFTQNDFKKFILKDETIDISTKNSEYLKHSGRSKPIMALEFKLAVDEGVVQLSNLDEATRAAIQDIVKGVASRVAPVIAEAA